MDPSEKFISPKPKKSFNGPRTFNMRSSYEKRSSTFEGPMNSRSFPRSTKSLQNTKENFNESTSTKDTLKYQQSIASEPKSREVKFNFFEDIENELTQTSIHEEILSILSDSCKSSFNSQDELNSNNYFSCSDSTEDYKRKLSIYENRPENPAFKNFDYRDDFLDVIKKSLSEDFNVL